MIESKNVNIYLRSTIHDDDDIKQKIIHYGRDDGIFKCHAIFFSFFLRIIMSVAGAALRHLGVHQFHLTLVDTASRKRRMSLRKFSRSFEYFALDGARVVEWHFICIDSHPLIKYIQYLYIVMQLVSYYFYSME